MPPEADNGKDDYNWVQYRRLILSELQRIASELHDLNRRMDDQRMTVQRELDRRDRAISALEVQLATVHTKIMFVSGGLSAMIAAAVSIAIKLLTR